MTMVHWDLMLDEELEERLTSTLIQYGRITYPQRGDRLAKTKALSLLMTDIVSGEEKSLPLVRLFQECWRRRR
jgi:hypothetical protein